MHRQELLNYSLTNTSEDRSPINDSRGTINAGRYRDRMTPIRSQYLINLQRLQ